MTTSFVSNAPSPVQPQSTSMVRIDTDAVTRAAFEANNAALTGYLRTVAPLPSWRNGSDCTIDAEPRGVAAPHEAHERSRRYGWTLIAIVVLSIVATGGLAFTAYNLGMIPHVGLTVAIWIGGGGSLAIYLVQQLQRHDLAHSPEAIALTREQANAYATETDADSRQLLTKAYADSITTAAAADADARRASAQLAQQRIDADLARLQTTTVRPVPPPVTDLSDDLSAPVPPPVATCSASVETCAPMPPTVAAVVLAWLDAGLRSGDIQPGRPLRIRAPWSARGDLPAAVKPEVARRLATCEPPLFRDGDGRQVVFGPYSANAARAVVRHVLADL